MSKTKTNDRKSGINKGKVSSKERNYPLDFRYNGAEKNLLKFN